MIQSKENLKNLFRSLQTVKIGGVTTRQDSLHSKLINNLKMNTSERDLLLVKLKELKSLIELFEEGQHHPHNKKAKDRLLKNITDQIDEIEKVRKDDIKQKKKIDERKKPRTVKSNKKGGYRKTLKIKYKK